MAFGQAPRVHVLIPADRAREALAFPGLSGGGTLSSTQGRDSWLAAVREEEPWLQRECEGCLECAIRSADTDQSWAQLSLGTWHARAGAVGVRAGGTEPLGGTLIHSA